MINSNPLKCDESETNQMGGRWNVNKMNKLLTAYAKHYISQQISGTVGNIVIYDKTVGEFYERGVCRSKSLSLLQSIGKTFNNVNGHCRLRWQRARELNIKQVPQV